MEMKNYMTIAIIILLVFLFIGFSPAENYLTQLQEESYAVAQKKDPLYDEIQSKASQYEIPFIDAKVDRVWKAIPGYNGLKVDIDASFKKMKEDGAFNEDKLVFEQVSPDIHLHDLPPTPIYKGNPEKPMVSFIINVAWGNEYLSPILATLKKNKIHASFFLEGRWVKNNPDLAKMIVSAGHEVGNHSYSHPDMKLISSEKNRNEIRRTNEVIKATTGENPTWFGPPSGSFRDEVIAIAAEEKLKTVLWTVDTVDWRRPTPDELINRVMSKVHNGAMILMHPTDSTAKALDQLIKQIQDKGLEINTVSELLSENRVMKNMDNK